MWVHINYESLTGLKDQIQILRIHLTVCKLPDWKTPEVATLNCSCPGLWRDFTFFGWSQLFLKIRHLCCATNFVCAHPNPGSGSAFPKYPSSHYFLRVRWGWSLVSWLWYSAVSEIKFTDSAYSSISTEKLPRSWQHISVVLCSWRSWMHARWKILFIFLLESMQLSWGFFLSSLLVLVTLCVSKRRQGLSVVLCWI